MASKDTKKKDAEPQAVVKDAEPAAIFVRVAADGLDVGGIVTSKKKGFILNRHMVAKLQKTAAHAVKKGEKKSISLYSHLINHKVIEEFTFDDDSPAEK